MTVRVRSNDGASALGRGSASGWENSVDLTAARRDRGRQDSDGWRVKRIDRKSDDGYALTMFLVVFSFTFLVITAMVVDGGRILSARREASNAAFTAARIGAQSATVDQLGYVFDEVEAKSRAGAYLNEKGFPSHSIDVTCAPTPKCTVRVTINGTATLVLLPMIGQKTKSFIVAGSARPATGIGAEDDQPT
jgi:Flp pilus assembly protein TadG